MDDFKDIYSAIRFNDDFYKLNNCKKWQLFEEQLKKYLENKIWLKDRLYKFDKKLYISELAKIASKYYGDEAISDLVHAVLNFASNMQGYHIVWYCSEQVIGDPVIDINEVNKWESLLTNKNMSYVEIFDFVTCKFYYYFFKDYKNIMVNRFMEYVSIPTNSDSNSKDTPSSINQMFFAKRLCNELQKMGINPIFDKKHGYVYAKIDGDKDVPSIGFISHMDTSEDAKCENINPLIIENYTGEDITYEGRTILSVKENPELKSYIGKTLITTDGTTLLGADDKAGIAEIMGMMEYFSKTDEPHGDIYVAFTPDEEIGKSIDYLDRNIFNPKYAYSVDGEYLGELSYENFNAADVTIKICGNNVHPGYAKNKMINSILIANKINNMLPKYETPNNTVGYAGYYHLHKLNGTVSETEILYLIRDFDEKMFQKRIDYLKKIVDELNKKFENSIEMDVDIRYKNMKEVIDLYPEVIDLPKSAMEKMGIVPYLKPIRGGTDGTRLSFEGIPCPNLGAGGHNFHSTQEYVCLEDMERIQELLINIVKEYYLTYKKEEEIIKIKKK